MPIYCILHHFLNIVHYSVQALFLAHANLVPDLMAACMESQADIPRMLQQVHSLVAREVPTVMFFSDVYLVQTSCQPRANLVPTLVQTFCQPHANLVQTSLPLSCQPHANLMPDLVPTSCQPRARPHANLMPTSCQPRANLVPTSCKPHATSCQPQNWWNMIG